MIRMIQKIFTAFNVNGSHVTERKYSFNQFAGMGDDRPLFIDFSARIYTIRSMPLCFVETGIRLLFPYRLPDKTV